jgi:IclR family acetate operon transcriptional repressor
LLPGYGHRGGAIDADRNIALDGASLGVQARSRRLDHDLIDRIQPAMRQTAQTLRSAVDDRSVKANVGRLLPATI